MPEKRLLRLRSLSSILADQRADHAHQIFGEAIVIGFQLPQALNHLHRLILLPDDPLEVLLNLAVTLQIPDVITLSGHLHGVQNGMPAHP